MLLSEDGYTTVPENDSLGAVTQLMMNRLTGQLAGYLEFYEFFEHSVLAGVPDFVAADMVDGDTYTVIPAAFGALSQGILNVSKDQDRNRDNVRLTYKGGKYTMQILLGDGKTPPKWEECGWDQPSAAAVRAGGRHSGCGSLCRCGRLSALYHHLRRQSPQCPGSLLHSGY